MINRVILLGYVEGEVAMLDQKEGRLACFRLKTWHRWRDGATGKTRTKTEMHLVMTSRRDLVDLLGRQKSIADLVYVDGALSAVQEETETLGGKAASVAAVVIPRQGTLRILGKNDLAAEDALTSLSAPPEVAPSAPTPVDIRSATRPADPRPAPPSADVRPATPLVGRAVAL